MSSVVLQGRDLREGTRRGAGSKRVLWGSAKSSAPREPRNELPNDFELRNSNHAEAGSFIQPHRELVLEIHQQVRSSRLFPRLPALSLEAP